MALRLSCLAGAMVLAGCYEADTTLAGDARELRCEARSNADPGSLNIDSDSDGYSFRKPCTSYLNFYIARNTSMRSASGELAMFVGENDPLNHGFQFDFMGPVGGFYKYDYALPTLTGNRCNEVKVQLNSLVCQGEDGGAVKCPAVRVKASLVFEDLKVASDTLDVCYDD